MLSYFSGFSHRARGRRHNTPQRIGDIRRTARGFEQHKVRRHSLPKP